MVAHYFNSSKSYIPVLFGICFLAIGIYFAARIWFTITQLKKTTYEQSRIQTQTTAQQLTDLITQTQTIAQELAEKIATSQTNIQELLESKPKSIFGIGFTQINSAEKNNTLYYVEHGDGQEFLTIANITTHEWAQAAYNGKSGFYGPLADPATGDMVIIYAMPIYQATENIPTDIVFVTQSLAHLNHLLTTFYAGEKSYWFIAQADGSILLHPTKQSPPRTKFTLENIMLNLHNNEYNNEITGNRSWFISAPIAPMNWQLHGVFDQKEIPLNSASIRHLFFYAIICLLLVCISFAFLALCQRTIDKHHIWIFSGSCSLFLFISIAALWWSTWKYNEHTTNFRQINDKVSLYEFLDSIDNSKPTPGDELNYYLNYRYRKGGYVPTGIYINSIDFTQSDEIEFVGYIWQRYFQGTHDGISRGFIFPQLADTPTIEEISHIQDGRTETIMWLVRAKLNQNISYKKYPFDVKNFQFHIWHKDFSKNIILVPDLDAYQILNPHALPGIDSNVAIPGWNIYRSMFGYDKTSYDTNFGLYSYGQYGVFKSINKSDLPELLFNVTAQRALIDTIIVRIIPLLVIAILLFIIILTDISQGFAGLVASAAAIFFGLIIAHMQFREKLPGTQVVYLETFFLIMYITIMLVLISSMLDLFKTKLSLVRYKNNIIIKALYWPTILSMILICTLIYLY